MIGYPYSYGDDDLVQKDLNKDEKFMIFSLDPVAENSELNLNLTQASSLSVLAEPFKLELGDEFTYQFCEQISQLCGTLTVIPETETLVLDYNGFCNLVSKSDIIVSNLSSDLQITKESAMEQAQNFFRGKNVIVQPGGAQGAIYKVGSYLQSAGSAGLVAHTIALAKLTGVSGFQILQAQPYLFVAIPTTGFIFFHACGAIAGNTTIGKIFTTTGDVLAIPMKGVEMMWNSYGNPIIQKIIGIPVILNMTQTFKRGPGYTVDEVAKYISLHKTSIVKIIKDKLKSGG